MSFEVGADVYGRLMNRYSEPLAVAFADAAGIRRGQRALDVGCGPGALTAELVGRLGSEAVCAVDPSRSFVAAARERLPGVDIRLSGAERIPFPDGAFGAALAQLSVHFMTDPVAGLREMARVTGPGGIVAACVWDHFGGRSPVALVWQAAHELDPSAPDESGLAGVREGHLVSLFAPARPGRTPRRSPCGPVIPRSNSGGSRSPSASARPAYTCGRSPNRPATGCAHGSASWPAGRR